ncbi:GIY-YIG nuclease family protein [Novosphingobium sp. YJ-S2-02]|uniref:GIY-YIG nuclease family protein n=1 Tax=Novosphingobium aureum TaxID=2792964 RepID=A0A931HAL3_9SPHN|nr:GIY-YIG nuclease family protein [Novosphingobium aureum]MBH0112426.1 GIY-YIG nuclease family protein [Novosphingobium aureum]
MDKLSRKNAQTAYRERAARPGIYALKSSAGPVWGGRAPNLDTIVNRVVFTLRQGTSPHRTLQAAWNVDQGRGMVFEELEELDPDDCGLALERVLTDRHSHWIEKLEATRI